MGKTFNYVSRNILSFLTCFFKEGILSNSPVNKESCQIKSFLKILCRPHKSSCRLPKDLYCTVLPSDYITYHLLLVRVILKGIKWTPYFILSKFYVLKTDNTIHSLFYSWNTTKENYFRLEL